VARHGRNRPGGVVELRTCKAAEVRDTDPAGGAAPICDGGPAGYWIGSLLYNLMRQQEGTEALCRSGRKVVPALVKALKHSNKSHWRRGLPGTQADWPRDDGESRSEV